MGDSPWYSRAWSWFRAHWQWVVIPVGLILAALPWLRRARVPSPGSGAGQGGGPTGDAAEDAREVVRDAAGDARAAADERASVRLTAIEEARARMREGKP